MIPKKSWKFTDKPDWARLAREVGESGGSIARVSVGRDKFTIVNFAAKKWPDAAVRGTIGNREVVLDDATSYWIKVRGDRVAAFLEAPAVEVATY